MLDKDLVLKSNQGIPGLETGGARGIMTVLTISRDQNE